VAACRPVPLRWDRHSCCYCFRLREARPVSLCCCCPCFCFCCCGGVVPHPALPSRDCMQMSIIVVWWVKYNTPGAEGFDRCVLSVWTDNRRLYEKSVERSLARLKVLHVARIHRVCLMSCSGDRRTEGYEYLSWYAANKSVSCVRRACNNVVPAVHARSALHPSWKDACGSQFSSVQGGDGKRTESIDARPRTLIGLLLREAALPYRQGRNLKTPDALKHVSHGHSCIRTYGHRQRMFLYR